MIPYWLSLYVVLILNQNPGLASKTCVFGRLTMYMDCQNLNLGELHPDTYPVNNSNIKDLILHHNGLRNLEYNVFYRLTMLINLDLSDNLISTLDHRLFITMPKLKTLNLRNNRITSLTDSRIFENQKNLSTLILDFNRLKYIDEGVFKPLASLIELYLFGNSFDCNCELRETVLWLEMKNVTSGAICESPPKYMNLSWHILSSEKCDKTQSTPEPKQFILDSRCFYNKSAVSLNCTNVPLRTLQARNIPIDTSVRIKSFILKNASISSLDYDVFHLMTNLQYLDLSINFLDEIDKRVFLSLINLKTLFLTQNKLIQIDNELFKSQKGLQSLNLDKNHLTHLSKKSLTPLESLKQLNLSENRLVCDCELTDTLLWCEERNISSGATCSHPPLYSGTSWKILKNFTKCKVDKIPKVLDTTTDTLHYINPTTGNPNSIIGKDYSEAFIISILCVTILFLLCTILAMYLYCRRVRTGKTSPGMELYDDIALEEREEHQYDVLNRREDMDESSFRGRPMFGNFPSKSDSCNKLQPADENTYEDIEIFQNRNAKCESYLTPVHMLEPRTKTDPEKKKKNVPSYLDFEDSKNRKENEYIFK